MFYRAFVSALCDDIYPCFISSRQDYLDDPTRTLKHDYDSAHKGGNRYATILLYMTDMEEGAGGETVFTKGWPVGQAEKDHVSYREVCSFYHVFELAK